MKVTETTPSDSELNPVDDVRRVRAKMSRDADDNVRLLADRAAKAAEALCENLGLQRVVPSQKDLRK